MWHIAEIYSGNKRRKHRMAGLPAGGIKGKIVPASENLGD